MTNARSEAAKARWKRPGYREAYNTTIASRYASGRRLCTYCNIEKDVEEFSKRSSRRQGSNKCTVCSRIVTLKYKIQKNYGISWEEFISLLESVEYRCEICDAKLELGKKNHSPHLDHNHSTNQIRGILCGLCNRGLGQFKDNPARLEAALVYLRTKDGH